MAMASTSSGAAGKRKREVEGADWVREFTSSAFATQHLHKELGPGWTAVLLEACCVKVADQRALLASCMEDTQAEAAGDGLFRLFPSMGVVKVQRYQVYEIIVAEHLAPVVASVHALQACIALGYEVDAATFWAAAHAGNVAVLRWLHAEGYTFQHRRSKWQHMHKHLVFDELLGRSDFCVWDAVEAMYVCAAAAGRRDVIAWLKDESEYPIKRCVDGHGDTAQGYGTPSAMFGAAYGGQLDLIRWLAEGGFPWNKGTCVGAARGGHLDVLTYLHDHGCPWDQFTCEAAAEGGHLDVLRYARSHGCVVDESRRPRVRCAGWPTAHVGGPVHAHAPADAGNSSWKQG